jgi:tetratricopeptide (TPR) repeat protein/tRNA A-37 threonylcarbamoyl transferase component Bud32
MIFGKYQLLELLGRGGMAEVFKAKSYGVEGFEKLLVIKRILPTLTDNERFVEMFINEAKIAVCLNHANIVQVFDLGKVGDSYYIAMEFVHGLDLSTLLKKCREAGRPLPPELAAYMASEVAKGLDYAHRRRGQNLEPLGIVHRDISPHNVLVSYEGEVKITDFGIARAKTTLDEEEPGVVKGKYAYMAPEQALALPHDRRVDIFALGVVLYEALTGANPFKGLKVADAIHKAQNRLYPPLRETAGGAEVPAELAAIVQRAMEAVPDSRFDHAGAFYEELISFLYSAGARVGAHSVAAFLQELRDREAVIDRSGEARLVEAIGGETVAASTAAAARDGSDPEEITSVQVPTAAGTDTVTSTTGTRGLMAELRDVTVVAIELIGPTPPPELIARLLTVLDDGGGSVVDERGDLIVALFGVDVADGRDTQDAIGAALRLQRTALSTEGPAGRFQIGVGVHPDKIVVTAGGKVREDDTYYRAVQAARDLAKRGVGWVCTSSAGRDLAADSFRFEEVTTTAVAGVEQLVCKVVGRRPVAETYGRIFGRRDQLRAVGEALALVSRGAGRVVCVEGEPGCGKSRLMHEVNQRLSTGGHEVGWYEAPCLPWRHDTPYSAVAGMFRSILALGEIEQRSELRAKVERLRELGLIPEEVDAVAVVLGADAEHDASPEDRGRQLRSALIRAASSLAADKLTVLFWDDLQDADNESLEILQHLSRSIGHVPLLLTLAGTPGSTAAWEQHPACTAIRLLPLSETDSRRLALSRLGVKKAPEDLLMEVALKSDGNPLYIEEYVKALVASGIVSVLDNRVEYAPEAHLVDLPKTLRGLVSARVKRLPSEQKGLLQRAAVMGQRFNLALLSRVTGVPVGQLRPVLLGLKDVGLVTRISAAEFAFATELVRDVVYQGIVLTDRREIHAAVAAAIEDMFSDRIDEFVERLAVHYQEGGNRQKAVDYLIRAGRKVAADYSHRAALDHYLKALDLLHNVPRPDSERILSLYLPIGELAIKSNQHELGIQKMRLAEQLADELGDQRSRIQVLRLTAELHGRSDRFAESQQYFQHAIQLADELGDPVLRCEVRATAGAIYILLGDMKKAAPFYREAIELCRVTGDGDLQIACMSQLGKAEANSGEVERAVATISEAERLITPEVSPETRCTFERSRAQVYYMSRDIEKSVAYSVRALEIAREYNLKDQIAANAHNLGDDFVLLGDYRKAFSYLRMSQEVAEEIGFDLVVNLNKIFLAFVDALKFASHDGLAQLEAALEQANERNTVWEQVQVHYFLGRIHFERKQYPKAREHLEQSLRIGRAAENRIYESQAVDLLEQLDELGA